MLDLTKINFYIQLFRDNLTKDNNFCLENFNVHFTTLYNVCSVPCGCSVPWERSIPWEDLLSTVGDILSTVFSTMGDTMSTVGDIVGIS